MLEDIEARHAAWYACDSDMGPQYTGEDHGATWADPLDFVDSYQLERGYNPRQASMAHEIIREDVPAMIARIRELEARVQRLEGGASNG